MSPLSNCESDYFICHQAIICVARYLLERPWLNTLLIELKQQFHVSENIIDCL